FPAIEQRLQTSDVLTQQLCFDGTYYALQQRSSLLELRQKREAIMATLSPRMIFYGRILAYFPFVEFVGITGALAMHNPSTANDDLDYLVVTRPGRVWLTRASIILLVRLMRLRHVEICPNYVLASDQLTQSRQDLYIAHEIAQILPLCNPELYEQFRNKNPWTHTYLPNATYPLHRLKTRPLHQPGLMIKRGLEMVLSSPLGNWIEKWEFKRKAKRFEQQAQAPNAAAQIDESHVKGHFNDYGQHVLAQYQARLAKLNIETYSQPLKCVGD
ncbi:MAG: hypothetical protein CUN56_14990, partial [Phototrophicales bacterium]